MSDGSEFQLCGAATENARRANSVRVLVADSIGASEDRRGRTGTAKVYRLDKHWSSQDVLFDFNADLTGTGSVPICM